MDASTPNTPALNIPAGIHFDCSGCGNCCLGWPVPLTADDASKLPSSMIKRLQESDDRLKRFSHSLEKSADGRCAHLTELNRCGIHEQWGENAKPSMCRLFPYSFTLTPSGIFAYVSFASSAVLWNLGTPLHEQHDLLLEKWHQFQELFPNQNQDWSTMQIVDGTPLNWDEYLLIEKQLLYILERADNRSLLDKLKACSEIVISSLPDSFAADQLPPLEATPEIIDQLLLKHLFKLYLPNEVFADNIPDLNPHALLSEIVSAPNSVSLDNKDPNNKDPDISFQDLLSCRLEFSAEADELFRRFVYCRIFAKKYFGPGFGHLSLLAGVHHLYFLISILALAMKQLKLQKREPDFTAAAELLRTAERRLTQVNFSSGSSAILEVLLRSPGRLQRIAQFLP